MAISLYSKYLYITPHTRRLQLRPLRSLLSKLSYYPVRSSYKTTQRFCYDGSTTELVIYSRHLVIFPSYRVKIRKVDDDVKIQSI